MSGLTIANQPMTNTPLLVQHSPNWWQKSTSMAIFYVQREHRTSADAGWGSGAALFVGSTN